MDPLFNEFIDKLNALKGVGGNCHFEWRLFKKIRDGGKPIGQLTVDEFMAHHEATNREYNEIATHIHGVR